MIIRKEPDGTLLVIGQTDHSRLVGQVAAHWGNDAFAPPAPYESVVRAAAFHDYGWLRYETRPLLDGATGEPYQFLNAPVSPEQLASYQWSLDWMAGIDPYAGLIVSMHRTGLWKGRYGTMKHPEAYNLRTITPEIAVFLERNEAAQERERARLDADQVWTNYRLLQVWDLLGLYFCCREPVPDHVEPVPVRYGDGAGGVRLTLRPDGPRRVAFDPYPFDVRPGRLQLAVRRLPAVRYPDVEAFRRAYFRADLDLMHFELV
jgi:hypothetical protein